MKIYIDTSPCRHREIKKLPNEVDLPENATIMELFESLRVGYYFFVFVRNSTILGMSDKLKDGDVIKIIEN